MIMCFSGKQHTYLCSVHGTLRVNGVAPAKFTTICARDPMKETSCMDGAVTH